MYPESAGNPHQRGQLGVTGPGLDALEGVAGDAGG